jgi:hypothetical protein
MSSEQIAIGLAVAGWLFQAGATWQRVSALEAQVKHLTELLERYIIGEPRKAGA